MTEIDRALAELGVIAKAAPPSAPQPPRPDPYKAPGVWFRDGIVPF